MAPRKRNSSPRTRAIKKYNASRPKKTRSPGRELAAKNAAKRAGKKAVAAAKSKRVNATSPSKRRGYDNARIRGAQAAKRRGPDKPKKDTRTRGGQGSQRSGMDQVAFQKFVNMTPAQQRYVVSQAKKARVNKPRGKSG